MRKQVAGACLGALFFSHAQAAQQISYNETIRPIFLNSCLNCHNPDKKKAGLDLSTYDAAMDGSDTGKVIEPGDTSKSLLWRLVTHAEEPTMPAKSDKLADSQLDLIRKWIEAGAPENSGSVVASASAHPGLAGAEVESRPSGPPPMPHDLLLEPIVHAARAGAIAALAASPWAPLVAVGGQKQVLLYNTDTLELAAILPFPEGFPDVLKFTRDGRLVLAGGGVGAKLGRVVVWDVTTGERVAAVGEEFDQVLAADMSPDHTRIALGGPNRLVKIYSTRDGSLLQKMKKHTDWVTALAFTPDGKFLVTGDRAGGLVIWDSEGREMQSISAHQAEITSVVCVGKTVATASEDGKVKFWDINEGKEIKSWQAHPGGVTALAAVSGGGFVTCGRDRVARLWDSNGNRLREFERFQDVAMKAAAASGKIIAGDWTGALRVWTPNGQRIGDLDANPPTLAEHVNAAAKRLAELQLQIENLAAQRKKMEDEARKADADVRSVNIAVNAKEEQVKTGVAQIASLKKDVAARSAALRQAQNDFAQLDKSRASLEETLTRANAARDSAIRAQADSQKELEKKGQVVTETADAERAAQAAADVSPDDPILTEKASLAKAFAEKSGEELAAVRKLTLAHAAAVQRLSGAAEKASSAVVEKRKLVADAKKSIDEKKISSDEAQSRLAQEIVGAEKVREELAELKKSMPEKTEKNRVGEVALAVARQKEETAQRQLSAAVAELKHWRAAQANIALHRAQEELDRLLAQQKQDVPVALAVADEAAKNLNAVNAKIKQLEENYAALKQQEDAARTLTLASKK